MKTICNKLGQGIAYLFGALLVMGLLLMPFFGTFMLIILAMSLLEMLGWDGFEAVPPVLCLGLIHLAYSTAVVVHLSTPMHH